MNGILGTILSTIAPTVASAFLGPLGGVAVAAIARIVGVSDATLAGVSKAFEDGKITPDHLAEIKKLELEYQNEEKERGFKYTELEFKDKDSARAMQRETKSVIPAILTILVTCGFFGILGWMMLDDTIQDSPPLLIMLGQLSAGWAAIIAFWFGSTSSSARTRELLAQSAPAK